MRNQDTADARPVDAVERDRILATIAVRARVARDPGALFPAVGDALLGLGLHCYVGEWDEEVGEIVIRYLSFRPAMRRAAEAIIGRSIDGFRFAVARIPPLELALRTGQPQLLLEPAGSVQAALPWLPRPAIDRLLGLLGARHIIVAPLMAGGSAHGALVVLGRSLTDDDLPFMAGLGEYVGEALVAARTLEAAQRRQAATLALGELSARVAEGAAAEELPALAVRALRTPLGAAAVSVWLLDDSAAAEPVLRLAAQEGLPMHIPAVTSDVPLRSNRAIARAAREGRSFVVRAPSRRTAGTETDDLSESRVILAELGFGLGIRAPLRSGERTFGALSLNFTEARSAPADEQAFVAAVATQVAAALENARLLAEARTQAARASMLADLAALLTRSLDVTTLLDTLARRTSAALGGAAGVYRALPGQETFEVAAMYHPDPATLRRILRVVAETPPHPGIGVFGLAYTEGRPMLVQYDAATLAAMAPTRRIYTERLGVTSAIAVPLQAHGRALGVLTAVTMGDEPPFGAQDLTLATAIGNLAAQSLDNARAYAEAAEGHRRLAATFQSMVDPIILYDAQGRIIDFNEAALHLLGHTDRAEALSTAADYLDRLHIRDGEGRPLPANELASVKAIHGETVVGHAEILRDGTTGLDRHLIVNAAPIPGDGDAVAGAMLVAHDVTSMREAERLKDEFLGVASHELKTPLTPLKGFAQIMIEMVTRAGQNGAPPLNQDRLLRYLRMMDGRIDHLIQLVGAMLDLSRLRRGPFALELAPADLVAVAAGALAGFESPHAEPHSARHHMVFEAPPSLVVCCDAQRIDQVLTNLLANALKYSPDGGTVALRLAREGEQASVTVEDEGIGIPEGEEEALFQPFTRGSNAPVLQYAGVGLGLYICREIVERHGGHIAAARRAQGGTAIRLTLPLAGPHGAAE